MGGRVVPSPVRNGPFEELAIGRSSGTVGWVIQGYANERIDLDLAPGTVRRWDDARSRGKVPGQPVLFLRTHPRGSRWVGWGRVVEPEERWRVLGVAVRCEGVARPGLPVVASGYAPRPRAGIPPELSRHEWEFRELGFVLGLATQHERPPYLESDARDLRLSAHDLRFLLRLQPALARLGRESAV